MTEVVSICAPKQVGDRPLKVRALQTHGLPGYFYVMGIVGTRLITEWGIAHTKLTFVVPDLH